MGAQTKAESKESKSALLSKQVGFAQTVSMTGLVKLVLYFYSGGTLAAADPTLLVDAGMFIGGQLASYWRYSGDNKKLHIKKPKSNYTVSELDE